MNRFNRRLLVVFTDERKAVSSKAPNRATGFDGLTKILTINFLNVFSAKENREVFGLKQKKRKIFL